MPRSISTALKADFQSQTPSIVTCAKLTRKDAYVVGFTTWDQPLIISGVTYTPINSINPTSVKTTSGTSPDNLEVIGAISSDLMLESDFVAGLWNDALIEIFKVAYDDLAAGKMTTFVGNIVEIELQDGIWHVECQALSGRLKQIVGDESSLTCRVNQFCDNQCKLNVATFTFARTVSSVIDALTIYFGGDTHATGFYNFGWVTCTSGLNAGLTREVKSHVNSGSTAQVVLRDPFPFVVNNGDGFNMIQGCDHEFSTCKAFGNAINFRGEPFIPGNDILTRVGRQPQ